MPQIWFKPLFKVRKKIFALLNTPNQNQPIQINIAFRYCFPNVRRMTWKREKLCLRVLKSASIWMDLEMSDEQNNHWLEFNNLSPSRYETCYCPIKDL